MGGTVRPAAGRPTDSRRLAVSDAQAPGGLALRLRPLRESDEAQARQAHSELAAEDFTFLLDWDPGVPWADHLELLRRQRRALLAHGSSVPATFLAAQVGSDLVGRVSIRHQLNDHLAAVGGHIGYAVRPGHRGRGYATAILRQALVIARAEGVEEVLVTCQESNAASAAVITRCGGVLEDVHVAADGRRTRRYWIH